MKATTYLKVVVLPFGLYLFLVLWMTFGTVTWWVRALSEALFGYTLVALTIVWVRHWRRARAHRRPCPRCGKMIYRSPHVAIRHMRNAHRAFVFSISFLGVEALDPSSDRTPVQWTEDQL